jgi:hypothetical protein
MSDSDALDTVKTDVTKSGKWYARAILIGIYLTLIIIGIVSVYGGVLSLSLSPTASPDISQQLNYLVWGFAIGTLIFFAGLIVMALPGSVIRALKQLADNYEIQDNE